jgi:hypothetical protein
MNQSGSCGGGRIRTWCNCLRREQVRLGNWLRPDQAIVLLEAPDPETIKGKRDPTILAILDAAVASLRGSIQHCRASDKSNHPVSRDEQLFPKLIRKAP